MRRRPSVTLALVAISVLVYVIMTYVAHESVVGPLLISQYLQPPLPEVQRGQIWRLITPIFLHSSLFHLVFNMLWTWELGRLIEARQGAPMLIALTVLIGVLSNLGQFFVTGPLFGGMSGVVYGYFGYVWIQGLTNPAFGVRLNPPVVYLLLGWFAVCWSGILEALFNLQIGNAAHTGGLISGMLLALAVTAAYRARLR